MKVEIIMKKYLAVKKGNAWVGILILLVLMTTLGLALVTDSIKTITQSKRAEQVVVAQALVDAGIDKAIWKLNKTAGYTGENGITLPTGVVDIAITNVNANNKQVIATAYIPSKTSPKVIRKVRANLAAQPSEQSVSFRYAIQGGTGGISVSGSSDINGNLYSNAGINITGSADVSGSASAHTTVSGSSHVHGTVTNGAPIVALPTVDVATLEAYATSGGTITGNYSPPSGTTNLGPKKITGNVSMTGSNSIINLTGPLYIQGNLSMSGSGTSFKLDNSFVSNGTVIIVDGTVSISGSGHNFITNSSNQPIMVLSNSGSSSAISYTGSGTSDDLIIFAPNGGISFSGSGKITAMCGQTLDISGSGDIDYSSGMASADFSTGPGGIWVIKEWQIIH